VLVTQIHWGQSAAKSQTQRYGLDVHGAADSCAWRLLNFGEQDCRMAVAAYGCTH